WRKNSRARSFVMLMQHRQVFQTASHCRADRLVHTNSVTLNWGVSSAMLNKTGQSERAPNPNEKPENCYCSALLKGSAPCGRWKDLAPRRNRARVGHHGMR